MKLLQVARRRGRHLALAELREGELDGDLLAELYAYPGDPYEGSAAFTVYAELWGDTSPDGNGELCGGEVTALDGNIGFRFTFDHLVNCMASNCGEDREDLLRTAQRIDAMIKSLRELQETVELELSDDDEDITP